MRRSRCGIVLSEQGCSSGEMPDAIGWKGKNHSIVIECKISRADFLADCVQAMAEESSHCVGLRALLTPLRRGCSSRSRCPKDGGCWRSQGRELKLVKKSKRKLRQPEGLMNEMNLLLASLRRVEVRIEPQRIADFLKWKNRMAAYNGGALPEGIVAPAQEENSHLV